MSTTMNNEKMEKLRQNREKFLAAKKEAERRKLEKKQIKEQTKKNNSKKNVSGGDDTSDASTPSVHMTNNSAINALIPTVGLLLTAFSAKFKVPPEHLNGLRSALYSFLFMLEPVFENKAMITWLMINCFAQCLPQYWNYLLLSVFSAFTLLCSSTVSNNDSGENSTISSFFSIRSWFTLRNVPVKSDNSIYIILATIYVGLQHALIVNAFSIQSGHSLWLTWWGIQMLAIFQLTYDITSFYDNVVGNIILLLYLNVFGISQHEVLYCMLAMFLLHTYLFMRSDSSSVSKLVLTTSSSSSKVDNDNIEPKQVFWFSHILVTCVWGFVGIISTFWWPDAVWNMHGMSLLGTVCYNWMPIVIGAFWIFNKQYVRHKYVQSMFLITLLGSYVSFGLALQSYNLFFYLDFFVFYQVILPPLIIFIISFCILHQFILPNVIDNDDDIAPTETPESKDTKMEEEEEDIKIEEEVAVQSTDDEKDQECVIEEKEEKEPANVTDDTTTTTTDLYKMD